MQVWSEKLSNSTRNSCSDCSYPVIHYQAISEVYKLFTQCLWVRRSALFLYSYSGATFADRPGVAILITCDYETNDAMESLPGTKEDAQ